MKMSDIHLGLFLKSLGPAMHHSQIRRLAPGHSHNATLDLSSQNTQANHESCPRTRHWCLSTIFGRVPDASLSL